MAPSTRGPPLARCPPPTSCACTISRFCLSAAPCSSFPLFVLSTPEHTFDIHVLRTFTRDLNGWIVRLQSTSPDASETINQVIYALNHTFREVELSYRVWRNERIQSILQHGKFFPTFPRLSEGQK